MRRSVVMSRLTARMSPVSEPAGSLDHVLLDLVEPRLELVHLRPVVIDHRVDDPVQQRHRALAEDVLGARAQLADVRDAAPLAVVDGDQELRRQEEIGFVRLEAVLGGIEVDPVQHDVEIAIVGLDLGIGLALKRRLDDQFVQAEDVAQDDAVGSVGSATSAHTTAPLSGDSHAGSRRSTSSVRPPLWTKYLNQSPTLTLSAACAAARRATGTRYGEQLT